MKVVYLFFLTDVRYGGFVTYTAHLAEALRRSGYHPVIGQIRKRTGKKPKVWAHGEAIQDFAPPDALAAAASYPTLITCAYWKKQRAAIEAFLAAGAALTLHDPTEFTPELLALARRQHTRIVAIRRPNMNALRDQGLDARFIPHPYVPVPIELPQRRKKNAVSISRIDFDKHTELIAEANSLLKPKQRVEIWGAENRLYAHHKLDQSFPNWRDDFRGRFPHGKDSALRIAAQATWVVDMSLIRGDGGGTQYTTLEAWQAGCGLIVQSGWIRPDGALRPGQNCVAVKNAVELRSALLKRPGPQLLRGGQDELNRHRPEVVVPEYADWLGW